MNSTTYKLRILVFTYLNLNKKDIMIKTNAEFFVSLLVGWFVSVQNDKLLNTATTNYFAWKLNSWKER